MSNVQLYKSRVFVLTWHLIAFVQFVYAIHYDWHHVKIPDNINLKMVQPGIGGRTRFLTYWCLVSRAYFPLSSRDKGLRKRWCCQNID